MKSTKALLLAALLAASSLVNAQVSDSTAIGSVTSGAPTLDCAANQIKVGSSCAVVVYSGVSSGVGCTRIGIGTLGFDASGELHQCIGGAWSKTSSGAGAGGGGGLAGCPSPTGVGTVPHGWNGLIGSWGCTVNSTCNNGLWLPPAPMCGYM